MTELATWLRAQMKSRGYNQIQTSVHTGVAQGTLSEILQKDHIPQIETLFRLAEHFDTDRTEILILAGHLQRADQLPRGQHPQPDEGDYLIQELVEEFRKVPDEWKDVVIQQLQLIVQMANRPPVRIIGEDTEAEPAATEEEEEEQASAQEPSEQVPAQVA